MSEVSENDALAEAERLNQRAFELYRQGQYDEAVTLIQKSLKIRQEQLGSDHVDVATSLNNLALLYETTGRYAEAEPLYQQSLKIRQEQLGSDHVDVAQSLNNLAGLYDTTGRYAEAEPLYQQSLKILQEQLGSDHVDVAQSLNNLAGLYDTTGRYAEAEPLYQQSLKILQEQLGSDHVDVATSLNNLAGLYQTTGRYAEAEPLYQQSLKILQEQLGSDHPSVANSLNNLALLYEATGRYAKAEPLYQQSLKIYQEQLGSDHPSVANSLNNLAILHWAQLNPSLALKSFQQALKVEESNLKRQLIIGSEAQKRQYLDTIQNSTNAAISLHLQSLPQSEAAAKLALETILRRKGRLLELLAFNQQSLRNNLDPQSQTLLNKLNQTYQALSDLQYSNKRNPNTQQRDLEAETLKQKIARIEADISQHSASLAQQVESVTLAQVQSQLPADSALIEFMRYFPYNPKQDSYGEPRYAAYLLKPNGQVLGVDLGAASDLEAPRQLLQRFQASLDGNSPITDSQSVGRKLYQRLMGKLEPHLAGVNHLMIAPDHQLNLLPFSALVDESGQYLVQRFRTISYLNSGRELRGSESQNPQLSALPISGQSPRGR